MEPASCTASATPVRPPARARLQERGLLGRSQRSVTPGGAKARAPAGACSGLKLGQHVAKKPGGAAKRKRVSDEDKVNALLFLKTMTVASVAAKLGIGESTLYSWKTVENYKDAAASGKV